MKILGLKLSLGAALWLSLATASANTNEFRGYWVDVFHPGILSSNEVTTLVDRMRSANCNAIVAEVRARANAYYNGSPYEPKGPGISPSDFDPLGDLILKGHDTSNGKQRLEIHAWLVTYKTSTAQPSAWMHKKANGTVSTTEYDPGHPDVQRRVFNVAMDITTRYDIDGLNFDYIRYPENSALGPTEWGYNDVTVARFNARFGRTGLPDVNDPVWNQFRRDQVTSLMRKVYLNVMAIKPWVKVSADTITWNPSPASVTEWTNSARAYNDVLQDWRSWMEEGILDYSIPMNYYRHGALNYAQDYMNWMNFAKDHQYGRHTIIGPGTYMNFATNVIKQFRLTRDPSPNGNYARGICGFSYWFPSTNNIVPAATMYQALVQSSAYDTNPIPVFAERATVPEMPWKTAPTKGHVKGFIMGATTTNYLDGATFTITGPVNRSFISDATGFYGSVDLPPGNYTVTGSYPGYGIKSSNIVVTAGSVTTADLLLPLTDIEIITHPQSQTIGLGTNATFTVQATGTAPLTYAWTFNGTPIPGATESAYTVFGAQPGDEGAYAVVVSNSTGQQQSDDAILTLIMPPTIVTQPESQVVTAGTSAIFSVEATGVAPLAYQWSYQGTPILNATNSTLTINNAQTSDSGSYTVVVGNTSGSVTSEPATLAVYFALSTAAVNGVVIKDPASFHYAPGSLVNVTAVPDANHRFDAWSDGFTNNPRTIIMASNRVLQALFTESFTPTEIIVDNPDALRTGEWTIVATYPGYWGTNYSYARVTNIAATATTTFRPNIPFSGRYDVSLWYTAGPNRTQNADWQISSDDGSETYFVNQQVLGSQWTVLGAAKQFSAGTNGFVVVANNGQDTSKVVMADAVKFTHIPAPGILEQPQDQIVAPGQNALFYVSVTGGSPVSYQWRFNGTNLAGATSNPLMVTNAQPALAGEYSVRVSNAAGLVISEPAELIVSPLRFSSITPLDDGIRLELTGAPGNYSFEGTTNFVDWLELTNVVWTNGGFEITDPVAITPHLFFRARGE